MTLGKIAYEAYYKASNGRSLVSGQQLPTWERQSEEIKEAWESAAAAVKAQVAAEVTSVE